MFERFSDRARQVLVYAQAEARLLNHGFIGTEHILLGLIHEGEGLAAKALESLGISLEVVRERVKDSIGPTGSTLAGSPAFTPRAKKVLELSLRESIQLGHNYIGTEHILLGLVSEGEGVAVQVLQNLGVPPLTVRERVIEILASPTGHDSPSRVASAVGSREWPRYPMRVVSGPSARLRSDGVEFWVTGVLFFDESVQVFWQLSGIPKPIADLMRDSELFSPNLQGHSSGFVALADDLNTTYQRGGSNLEARSDGNCTGTSLFTPEVPDSATRLSISWQGERIEIEV